MQGSLSFALALLGLCASLPRASAQVYDDFNGAQLSQATWYRYGELQRMSLQGGALRFAGSGSTLDCGVASIQVLRGDFDIVVDFQNYSARSSAGNPGFNLYAFDAIADPDQGAEIRVGLRSNGAGLEWVGEAELKGNTLAFRTLATTARAGQLRVQRASGRVLAFVRSQTSAAWTRLVDVADSFVTSDAKFVIESEAGAQGGADVQCDEARVAATIVTGAPGYGARCVDLGAVALNLPTVGNPAFAFVCTGGPALVNAPFAIALGGQQLAIDLTAVGAGGCALNASLDFLVVGGALDGEAQGGFALPIPQDQALVGARFYVQCLAATTGNAMGIAWSNGVAARVSR